MAPLEITIPTTPAGDLAPLSPAPPNSNPINPAPSANIAHTQSPLRESIPIPPSPSSSKNVDPSLSPQTALAPLLPSPQQQTIQLSPSARPTELEREQAVAQESRGAEHQLTKHNIERKAARERADERAERADRAEARAERRRDRDAVAAAKEKDDDDGRGGRPPPRPLVPPNPDAVKEDEVGEKVDDADVDAPEADAEGLVSGPVAVPAPLQVSDDEPPRTVQAELLAGIAASLAKANSGPVLVDNPVSPEQLARESQEQPKAAEVDSNASIAGSAAPARGVALTTEQKTMKMPATTALSPNDPLSESTPSSQETELAKQLLAQTPAPVTPSVKSPTNPTASNESIRTPISTKTHSASHVSLSNVSASHSTSASDATRLTSLAMGGYVHLGPVRSSDVDDALSGSGNTGSGEARRSGGEKKKKKKKKVRENGEGVTTGTSGEASPMRAGEGRKMTRTESGSQARSLPNASSVPAGAASQTVSAPGGARRPSAHVIHPLATSTVPVSTTHGATANGGSVSSASFSTTSSQSHARSHPPSFPPVGLPVGITIRPVSSTDDHASGEGHGDRDSPAPRSLSSLSISPSGRDSTMSMSANGGGGGAGRTGSRDAASGDGLEDEQEELRRSVDALELDVGHQPAYRNTAAVAEEDEEEEEEYETSSELISDQDRDADADIDDSLDQASGMDASGTGTGTTGSGSSIFGYHKTARFQHVETDGGAFLLPLRGTVS